MRFSVIETIYKAALENEKIYFLSGDLGHALADEFKKNLPERYYNTGLAEQNMIGIAAGLALSGNKVFVYSITPFATMRCFEQIKVDICYQNLNVTIIGVGAGFSYAYSGPTHHAIEDIAIMRSLPNMRIFSPSDPNEAAIFTEFLVDYKHPSYLRIGKGGENNLGNHCLEIGKISYVKLGKDIAIVATGPIIEEAIGAAELLEEINISTTVVNAGVLKPIDVSGIISVLSSHRAVFSLEEHNIIGGLGSAIAEIMAENPPLNNVLFKRFGVTDRYLHEVGNQNYLRERFSLDKKGLKNVIEVAWFISRL